MSFSTPFFVVGAQRSGTTLLRLMLAAHPRLAIPPESHFIPDLLRLERRAGGLAAQRDEIARLLVTHDRLVDFDLGAAFIRDTVQTLQPLTTRTITDALFAEYARRHDKPRWGDKTPRYCGFVPELRMVFPEARFIHVVRDGRDTALSSWKAAFGPRTWVAAAYKWRDSIRATQRGIHAVPGDTVLEVRYEELLRYPETILSRVCHFIGESFHDAMLRYSEQADHLVPSWEKQWHARLSGPVDGSNAGKWRTQLSPGQIALIQHIAGRELTAYGYDLVPIDLTPAAMTRMRIDCAHYHARCAAGWAVSFARGAQPMSRTAFRPAERES
jgi:hypothetical protein